MAFLFRKKGEDTKAAVKTASEFDKGLVSVKDLLAPSSIEVNAKYYKLNDLYAKTLFVLSYPQFVETNWLSAIVNADITMDISMHIYPIESATIMKTLQRKVTEMEASLRIQEEKGAIRDPELEVAYQDAEQLRDGLQRGLERFFRFGLYFTIYGKSLEEIDDISRQIESALGGQLIYTKAAMLQMAQGFASTLPQATDELNVVRNMTSSSLAATFPFVSFDLTSNDGILYGINRHNQSLILFDRFSLENANMVVLAKSGGGKSYAVKLEVLRSLMFDTDVFIIDPENEYKTLTDAVGGTFVDISLNSDKRINPFDLPEAGEEDDGEKVLRTAVITVSGLMNLMLGKLTPEESAMMDKAIFETYASRNITTDKSTHSNDAPTMQDLFNVLSSMQGGESLATRLQKYTEGTFAGIFNKPTNVDLDRGLVVFNIRDLEDELRPIAMYLVLDFIWSKVRSDIRKRLLVIDEAWIMMQHEDSAKFLYSIAKRARKYYLGLTTITQDVEDFLSSKYGRAVVANSSLQLLLRQSPASIDQIVDTFNLTDGERFLLLQAEVGKGLLFAGTAHAAIEVVGSFVEHRLATSNPEEVKQLMEELNG
jgi:conjugal transfer ATP-binding protein TraC